MRERPRTSRAYSGRSQCCLSPAGPVQDDLWSGAIVARYRLRFSQAGDSVYEGLTVGYCLALTQFVMVFTLGYLYLRRADTVYDPLAAKVIEQAVGDPYADRPAAGAATATAPAPTAPPAAPANRGAAR